MSVFTKLFKREKRSGLGKKLAVTAAVTLAVFTAGIVGTSSLQSAKVYAQGDCSGNSIMTCGATSRAAFIKKVKASSQLQKIYAYYGLNSSDYDDFINNAVPGVAYSNNTIEVNGHVVETSAGSIGRYKSWQGSNPRTVVIKGAGTYYGNLNSKSFANGTKSIPVDVLFNSKGAVQFAVMTGNCGNPIYGQPVQPNYQCKQLNAHANGNNNYSFTTDASAGNGAKITKFVYDFGDGSKDVTTTKATDVVKHTFTKSSKVTVTVYVSLPGGGMAKITNCVHQITFVPPAAVYACEALSLNPGDTNVQGNTEYTLTAKASAKNATVKSYNYTFGDGSKTAVVASNATSRAVNHTYAPGTYTASVSVTFLTNTGKTVTVTSKDCAQPLTVKPVASTLACVDLNMTPGTPDSTTGATTYTLTAKATDKNATITNYVFDFGDKSAKTTVTTANTTASTTHTYAVGTYTAQVTVNGKDIYGKAISSTVPACAQKITVKTPECKPGVPVGSPQCKPSTLACVSLTDTAGTPDSTTGATKYSFTATGSVNNGTITNYVFDFGDKSAKVTVPVTNSATTANATHTYTVGTYTAMVTVNGKDASGKAISATAPACAQKITVKTPECKPGVPVGSPMCKPSTLACVNLTMSPGTPDSTTGNTAYTLNATATADNATITGYVFNFGDTSDTKTVTTGSTTASTTHTYAPGTFTATVTVTGKDAAGNLLQVTAPACSKQITVKTPECMPGVPTGSTECYTQTCNLFTVNQGDNRTVTVNAFDATTTNPNASLANVVVDWGDNSDDLTSANVIGQQHQYDADGSYTITAVAHFTDGTQVGGDKCSQTVSFNTPVTPTPPVTPPTAPTALVNTGAGSVAGIFTIVTIASAAVYRFVLGRRFARSDAN